MKKTVINVILFCMLTFSLFVHSMDSNESITAIATEQPILLVAVYIVHNSKILLKQNSDCWVTPTRYLKSGELSKITAERTIKEETGLHVYNLRAICGFVEFTARNNADHIIMVSYAGESMGDKLSNNEYKWFGKNDLPLDLAPYIDKQLLANNLR